MNPDLKRELYAALEKEGTTLKDWLIRHAERYVSDSVQPNLFVNEELDTPRSPAREAVQS
jgi:hypothetical protein